MFHGEGEGCVSSVWLPYMGSDFEFEGTLKGKLPSEGGGLSTCASFIPLDTLLKSLGSFICLIFLKNILNIYLRERAREIIEGEAEGEAGSPLSREPNDGAGQDPKS